MPHKFASSSSYFAHILNCTASKNLTNCSFNYFVLVVVLPQSVTTVLLLDLLDLLDPLDALDGHVLYL